MLHKSILTKEFLSFFEQKSIRFFVDGTLGAGGHAKALLEAHPEIQCYYGIDQDVDALNIAKEVLTPFSQKITLIHGNFRHIKEWITGKKIDGFFLDLGVSSMQLDRAEKGFSFSKEGPLDMRMDTSQNLTAEIVVNTYTEKALGKIFCEYGEEPKWRRAAQAIVEARKKKKIKTTEDLVQALQSVLIWSGRKGKKIHPMTLVFQALRIFVNDELGAIEITLPEIIELLDQGGRLGVMSFHSLEDRIVKHTFKKFAQEKKIAILTKKPLIATVEEIKANPRSRSAKLRFIEKL